MALQNDNTPKHWPHTGAILIGGRSVRMGRPKHLIVLRDGRTMIQRIATNLLHVSTGVLVVGGGSRDFGEFRGIPDARPEGTGPLSGLEALLASDIDSEYLVVPCDMPLISAEILRAMVRPSESLATIVQLEHRLEPEWLPARISAQALPVVSRLLDSGERSVWTLMQSLPAEVVRIDRKLERALLNVNSPDELDQISGDEGLI
jgi:molybdopterin-guanine dinucleotide biosynthesis protein A